MRILFEEHQYKTSEVKDVLKELGTTLEDVDKKISVQYVGYFYNSTINDCVFILPKVLLKDKKNEDGKTIDVLADIKYKDENDVEHDIKPEDIISPEGQNKYLDDTYRKFIFEFSVWIYRALSVYKKNNPQSKALYYKALPQEGNGRRRRAETYLDIVLSLVRFNRENQDYFMFTIKNIHSGLNKINWNRTISKSQAIIQDNSPVYLVPVNKKRQINFEEELFIIFFSILNYLNETYGFKAPINCQYPLIKGKTFQNYLDGFGKTRLRQIKYKYFSDKALMLWDLCFAFFDTTYRISINAVNKEYLLAKKFEVVFEAIIDELIGTRREDIPKGLKDQDDGKRIDHLYTYQSLTSDNPDDNIYYIGDSKYYKSGHSLGKEAIYKQYTYARNVIQWNIDLFLNEEDIDKTNWSEEDNEDFKFDKEKFKDIRLRSDGASGFTEGYNVIPNFFLSAYVDKDRKYVEKENIKQHIGKNNQHSTHISFQFKNRLFDRDTLVLSHYDVNFLYVIYLYAREKTSEKLAWRDSVRKKFRDEIRDVIEKEFNFYVISPVDGTDVKKYVKDNFGELNGKLFTPYSNEDYISLALSTDENAIEENEKLIKKLKQSFYICKTKLGNVPYESINQEKQEHGHEYHNHSWDDKYVLVLKDEDSAFYKAFQYYEGIALPFDIIQYGNNLLDMLKVDFLILVDPNDIKIYQVQSTPEILLFDSFRRNESNNTDYYTGHINWKLYKKEDKGTFMYCVKINKTEFEKNTSINVENIRRTVENEYREGNTFMIKVFKSLFS